LPIAGVRCIQPAALARKEAPVAGDRPLPSCRSSVVEHSLGKGEVDSSILSGSTSSSSLCGGFPPFSSARACCRLDLQLALLAMQPVGGGDEVVLGEMRILAPMSVTGGEGDVRPIQIEGLREPGTRLVQEEGKGLEDGRRHR
jgi:hypothetical protein